MREDPSTAQAAIYDSRAEEYDALIAAEDADGNLLRTLRELGRLDDAIVADVGAGTGRFARLLASSAAHVHLVDRAPAMLEIARKKLLKIASVSFSIHVGDARSLPLGDASVHLAVAGWVFGHFPHWMAETWRDDVDAAVAEMRRVVRSGGKVVIVETLGTGHTEPRQHPVLDAYFAHLEQHHGFERRPIRTDYAFADAETAASVCGPFFGEELAQKIRREGWARVPECTAVFSATVG